jgi:hypothetical protein
VPDEKLEFWYYPFPSKKMYVGVNPHCLTKSVSLILKLLEDLKAKIPFEYTIADEPVFHILGGERKGIVSVDMTIAFTIDDDEAKKLLCANGFAEGAKEVIA